MRTIVKTYARIDSTFSQPTVMEIIGPATDAEGNEVPINDRFTAEFVADLVDITAATPQPACWWTAIEANGAWSFAPPQGTAI